MRNAFISSNPSTGRRNRTTACAGSGLHTVGQTPSVRVRKVPLAVIQHPCPAVHSQDLPPAHPKSVRRHRRTHGTTACTGLSSNPCVPWGKWRTVHFTALRLNRLAPPAPRARHRRVAGAGGPVPDGNGARRPSPPQPAVKNRRKKCVGSTPVGGLASGWGGGGAGRNRTGFKALVYLDCPPASVSELRFPPPAVEITRVCKWNGPTKRTCTATCTLSGEPIPGAAKAPHGLPSSTFTPGHPSVPLNNNGVKCAH